MTEALLELRGLRVSFRTEQGVVQAVDGLDLTLQAGEVLGVVGESGSGKSVSMLALLGLIDDPNVEIEGEALFHGRDLLKMGERELRGLRGRQVSMIFQDPMTSLNPVYSVGWQIAEQIRTHEQVPKRVAQRRAVELLESVGIPDPGRRVGDYPHQFSGGMRQRVMIAMALSCSPELLIADEPTTALDVTIQAQILELLDSLRVDVGAAVIELRSPTVALMYHAIGEGTAANADPPRHHAADGADLCRALCRCRRPHPRDFRYDLAVRLGASREPAKTARTGLGAPATGRCARNQGDPAAAHRRGKSVVAGQSAISDPGSRDRWIGHNSVIKCDTNGSSAGGIG